MPSVRRLAERFGTSVFPVHKALSRLREEGYVVTEPRAGTFVSDPTRAFELSETVVLGLSTREHVWGDLDLMLANRLHRDGLVPLTVDVKTQEGHRQLVSLARSEAQAIVIRGRGGLPADMFRSPPLSNKIVVGVVEWFGPRDVDCLRVLSDFEAGGRMVAEHFARQGHERVLLAAPQSYQIHGEKGSHARRHIHAFRRWWEASGRSWRPITVEGWEDREPIMDAERALSAVDPDRFGATAIYAYMDVLAWKLQRILRSADPALMEAVEIMGYFNTPWSEAAHPPLSSVDLNLERIADETVSMLEKAIDGETPEQTCISIPPRLVLRQ